MTAYEQALIDAIASIHLQLHGASIGGGCPVIKGVRAVTTGLAEAIDSAQQFAERLVATPIVPGNHELRTARYAGHGEGASHSLQRHSVGPPYPWMIVGTGIDAEYHYAYNGVTGERHPARLSYASALSDIGGLTKLRGLRRQDDDGVSTEPKGRIGESVTAMAERQTRDRDALRLVQPKPGDIDYTTPGPCPRRAATNYHEVPSPTGVRYTAPRVGAQYTLTLADAIELGLTHADELAASGGYPTRGIKSWAVLGAGAQTVEGLKAMPVWERLRYCDEVLMQFPSEQISRAIAWESDGAGVPEIVTALRQVFK